MVKKAPYIPLVPWLRYVEDGFNAAIIHPDLDAHIRGLDAKSPKSYISAQSSLLYARFFAFADNPVERDCHSEEVSVFSSELDQEVTQNKNDREEHPGVMGDVPPHHLSVHEGPPHPLQVGIDPSEMHHQIEPS